MMGSHRRLLLISSLLLALLLAPSLAAAQSSGGVEAAMQVENFEPLPDQHTNILNVATSTTLGHLGYTAGALLHFVAEPLRLVPTGSNAGNDDTIIVDNQFKGELWAGLGLSQWFDLGVVLPIVMTQSGSGFSQPGAELGGVDGATIGDLRIVPRVKLLPRDLAGGFGIALEGIFYAPTGDTDSFNGEDGFRAEPRLILDYLHDASGFVVALNAGYLIRERTEILNIVHDDVVRLSLGTGIPLGLDGLQLIGSVFAAIQTADNLDPNNIGQSSDDFRSSPVEALGGVRYTAPFGLHANLGAGTGLNNAIGAPKYRIFASIGFLPLDDDYDNDGYPDDEDSCPELAEDFDNWEDQDGCPESTDDRDGDGILDVDDLCVDDPEDKDGFQDEDGCPDTDNDGDGILDIADACPLDPEDLDGFEDEEGCPDPDNDKDGVLDVADQCPDDPEDLDGFQDENGCPDPDNDNDGILDVADACPEQPENQNGFEDDDGCPDNVKVILKKDKIEILDKVFFATNKATIKSVSYPLLDDVARIVNENPQLTRIRVEGHTDSDGKDSYNLDLSQRRAEAVVDYLVDQGVDRVRLEAVGYGEDRPIVENDSKENKAINRRVEFTIVERGEGGTVIETR